MKKPLVVYVDVDETFVRNYGKKRIPMPHVINHIKELKRQNTVMYCWSSGGADYAKASAEEFNIAHCFEGFLPKPEVMLDDLSFSQWHNFVEFHPNECPDMTVEKYRHKLIEE